MSKIHSVEIGAKDGIPVVFGHGWARDHSDFMPVAELVASVARAILLDLPGFGESPRPDSTWSTEDYANAVKTHLEVMGISRFIWVGHSFGGRVGLRLATMSGNSIDHLFLVASAGVKRPVPILKRLKAKYRSWEFQRRKRSANSDEELKSLEAEYGSPDYVQSREIGLRDVFLETVKEDQSNQISAIGCPTTLIYGAHDTETPPDLGRLIHQRIPGSTLIICPEFDHHSILSRGRHQITTLLLEHIRGGSA